MIHRIEIATRRGLRDARGEYVARRVRRFLEIPVTSVRTRDVYHIDSDLSADEAVQVMQEFADPVLHEGQVGRVDEMVVQT